MATDPNEGAFSVKVKPVRCSALGKSLYLRWNFDNFKNWSSSAKRSVGHGGPCWNTDRDEVAFDYRTKHMDALAKKFLSVEVMSKGMVGSKCVASGKVDLYTLAVGPQLHHISLYHESRHVGKLEVSVNMEEVAFVTFNVRDVHVVVQGIGAADIGIGIAYLAHVTAGSDRFVTTNSQPANRPFPHLKPLTVRAAFSDMMGSGLVLRIVKESSGLFGSDDTVGEARLHFRDHFSFNPRVTLPFRLPICRASDSATVGTITGNLVLVNTPQHLQMIGGFMDDHGVHGATLARPDVPKRLAQFGAPQAVAPPTTANPGYGYGAGGAGAGGYGPPAGYAAPAAAPGYGAPAPAAGYGGYGAPAPAGYAAPGAYQAAGGGGYPSAAAGYPSAAAGYPSAAAAYPSAAAGYPGAAGGYPGSGGGYPGAGGYPAPAQADSYGGSPAGYPGAAGGYPSAGPASSAGYGAPAGASGYGGAATSTPTYPSAYGGAAGGSGGGGGGGGGSGAARVRAGASDAYPPLPEPWEREETEEGEVTFWNKEGKYFERELPTRRHYHVDIRHPGPIGMKLTSHGGLGAYLTGVVPHSQLAAPGVARPGHQLVAVGGADVRYLSFDDVQAAVLGYLDRPMRLQFENPHAVAPSIAAAHRPAVSSYDAQLSVAGKSLLGAALDGGVVSPALKQAAAARLPEGWVECRDPSSGRTYYQNNVTHATQWDRPTF